VFKNNLFFSNGGGFGLSESNGTLPDIILSNNLIITRPGRAYTIELIDLQPPAPKYISDNNTFVFLNDPPICSNILTPFAGIYNLSQRQIKYKQGTLTFLNLMFSDNNSVLLSPSILEQVDRIFTGADTSITTPDNRTIKLGNFSQIGLTSSLVFTLSVCSEF
jgi:hypothetical protein